MTASTAETHRVPTLADYPDLTPEEMGRRFLKLIDSLKSIDDLALVNVQQIMQMNLISWPDGKGAGLNMHLPESDWHYGISYFNGSGIARNQSIAYSLFKQSKNQNPRDLIDMSPICAMDYNDYVMELKRIGFVEREEFAQYDTPQPPIIADPETGKTIRDTPRSWRLPVYFFTRPGLLVQIHERREANEPDPKRRHACVERISVRRYDQ